MKPCRCTLPMPMPRLDLAAPASAGVRVGEGERAVVVGGGAPIVVQSMTNTDTADVEATVRQVAALRAPVPNS